MGVPTYNEARVRRNKSANAQDAAVISGAAAEFDAESCAGCCCKVWLLLENVTEISVARSAVAVWLAACFN